MRLCENRQRRMASVGTEVSYRAVTSLLSNRWQYYVDGVASNAPANNLNSYIPAQDVVEEFKVVTNNVPAEYGNYAGGVINLTTKSGSNKFHGSAYEYLRNKLLDANDYFANRAGIPINR